METGAACSPLEEDRVGHGCYINVSFQTFNWQECSSANLLNSFHVNTSPARSFGDVVSLQQYQVIRARQHPLPVLIPKSRGTWRRDHGWVFPVVG